MRLSNLIAILIFSTGCGPDCYSDAELLANAKPLSFTEKEKQRIPFRTINKISFLRNDTQLVEYVCNDHKNYFEFIQDGAGDCATASYKREIEEHLYTATNSEMLTFHHSVNREYENDKEQCSFQISFGEIYGQIRSDQFDSIPFLASLSILGKNFTNIYLVLPRVFDNKTGKYIQDSVYYTKDFGTIRIRRWNNEKYEMVKIE